MLQHKVKSKLGIWKRPFVDYYFYTFSGIKEGTNESIAGRGTVAQLKFLTLDIVYLEDYIKNEVKAKSITLTSLNKI